MSDFWMQANEHEQQEYEEWLDEQAIIEEDHPSAESILNKLDYLRKEDE